METYKLQRHFKELLESCQGQVLQRSHSLLTDMFKGAEDWLLDASEKAKSNQLQNQYFEAMREIRRKRAPVEHEFRQQILNGFETFSQGRRITTSIKEQGASTNWELSLVEKDYVEESVAIQNIVSKANNSFFHTLYELRQRLAIINGGKKVDNSNMPAGPNHLCHSFWVAAQAFEVDIDVRIIIFSLFDQFVMRKAAVVYQVFNNQLIEAGILPNIGAVIRKDLESKYVSERAGPPPDPTTSSGGPRGERGYQGIDLQAGRELYQSLFQLLAIQRESNLPDNPGRYQGPSQEAWIPITRVNLVSTINSIQPTNLQNFGLQLPEDDTTSVRYLKDEETLDSIKETMIEEREQLFEKVDESEQSVDRVDADTIELVGMLFEFMLNYQALPNAAKALISHLHTPFLKVGVLDKEFLIRSSHPARQLLNMMVDAGCKWVNEEDLGKGIFPHMQEIVERVLDEFKDDVLLFDELLESFSNTVAEFETKTQVIENRSREAAKGRDKLQVAKQEAKDAILDCVGPQKLPDEMIHFLKKPWTDWLTFILLRNKKGKESETWKSAIKIVDALTWTVKPKNTEQDKKRLQKIIPKLRKSVEDALTAMGNYSQIHSEILFDTITGYHQRSAPGVQTNRGSVAASGAALGSVSGGSSQQAETETNVTTKLTPEEKTMVEKLKKTEYGTWFEFNVGDKAKETRAKLSWFSPVTGNCMFVDNAGVQCAVIGIERLASDVHKGETKILKFFRIPFVDRALEAIRNMLDRSIKKSA